MKKFLDLIIKDNQFFVLLAKNTQLHKPNRFVCTLSGGQDSIGSFVVLFHILSFFKKIDNPKTVILGNICNKFLPKTKADYIVFPQQTYSCFSKKESNNLIKTKPKTHFLKNKVLKKKKKKLLFNFKNQDFIKRKETKSFDTKLNKKKIKLYFVYCQHFWQTKNFFSSEFLFQISFLVKFPYTMILPNPFLISENRSREWRKKNFYRFLQLQKTSIVVTGHSKSDTLEKNLSNILRGTSSKSFSPSPSFQYETITSLFFYFLIFKPTKSSSSQVLNNKVFLFFSKTQFCKKNRFLLQKRQICYYCFSKKQKKESLYTVQRSNALTKKQPFLARSFGLTFFDKDVREFVLANNFFLGFKYTNFFYQTGFAKNGLNLLIFFYYFKNNVFKTIIPLKIFLFLKEVQMEILYFDKNTSLCKKIDFFTKKENFKKSNLFFVKKIHFFYKKNDNKNSFSFFSSTKKKQPFLIKAKIFRILIKNSTSFSFCLSTRSEKSLLIAFKPLETFDRFTISNFNLLYRFPISNDITNYSWAFSRNKIRHQFVPFIRFLFQSQIESLLTKFFSLTIIENQQNENEILKLVLILEYFRFNFFKDKVIFLKLKTNLQPFFMLNWDLIYSNIEVESKQALVQKSIKKYQEIDLNFQQIYKLHKFL